MTIDVSVEGLRSPQSLRKHARRRIQDHLDRFGQEITTVRVRLVDVNGNKGGIDKHCHVHIRGPRVGTSVVKTRHENAYAAVAGALTRAASVADKKLKRRQQVRR